MILVSYYIEPFPIKWKVYYQNNNNMLSIRVIYTS